MPAASAKKTYDLFVSYSQNDRPLVTRFAEDLRARKVSLWYDRWEMRPGDTLRERISDGIARARTFMVLLTPASLGSDWVNYELNVGMLREIEGARLRVVPVLAGGVDIKEIPVDLRTKYCLDISTADGYDAALDQLVDLIHPERRERQELLRALRGGAGQFRHVPVLREYALTGHDQTVQIAALRGLAKRDGADATLVVIERLLNHWGVAALNAAYKILARRGRDGILGLAVTYFDDSREYHRKLDLFAEIEPTLAEVREQYWATPFNWHLPKVAEALFQVPDPDIRMGALISAHHHFGHQLGIPLPTPAQRGLAESYAEARIPGLLAALERSTWRRSF
jgi:hypothetical protein